MRWIYLSPHLDDAVFSCGGLIWEQTRRGDRVEVWTLFAGSPRLTAFSPFADSLHARWRTGLHAPTLRQEEDRQACAILGAQPRYFDYLDCIYRTIPDTGGWVINRLDDLFAPIHPAETHLLDGWIELAVRSIPDQAALVSPRSLGGHRDHRLTTHAAVHLASIRTDLHHYSYADVPYVLNTSPAEDPETIVTAIGEGENLEPAPWSISERGLAAWQAAAGAYRSQISSFWPDAEAMAAGLRRYWALGGWGLLPVDHHHLPGGNAEQGLEPSTHV
jgi:LmbE family N-acetylglucosaminyl deacetylase